MKFGLKIAFDGTNYHGFQLQNNAATVQGELEKALSVIFSRRCPVTGCSRTDAGVHAKEFYCCFEAETAITPEKLKLAVTANLPKDISVYECFAAKESYHPRFDAVKKTYSYTIWNGETRNPFLLRYALHYPYKIDEEKLRLAASYFKGTHDFAGFCSAGSEVKTTVRTIYDCDIVREGQIFKLVISANGFLYNMVRIIAGTLLEVVKGEIQPEQILSIIESLDRERAGATAAAHALCLEKVDY